MIKINLYKIEPRGEYREMEVTPGNFTIETLYK